MNPSENQNEIVVQKESIIAPLCKVTPLSKCLAAVVFIALPFVGGLVGYQLATEKTLLMQSIIATPVLREVQTNDATLTHPTWLSDELLKEGNWDMSLSVFAYVIGYSSSTNEVELDFVTTERYPEEMYMKDSSDENGGGLVLWAVKEINNFPPATFALADSAQLFDAGAQTMSVDRNDINQRMLEVRSLVTFNEDGQVIKIEGQFQP